jgi:hypothetical protein
VANVVGKDLLHLLAAGFGPTRKRLTARAISGYWGTADEKSSS